MSSVYYCLVTAASLLCYETVSFDVFTSPSSSSLERSDILDCLPGKMEDTSGAVRYRRLIRLG